MLQSATWELGRKPRLLRLSAGPVLLAFRRSISHTVYRNKPAPQEAAATEKQDGEPSASSELDDFLNKFAARRGAGDSQVASGKPSADLFAGKHAPRLSNRAAPRREPGSPSRRISESVSREFFGNPPEPDDEDVDAEENPSVEEERALGYVPFQSSARDESKKGQEESRENEFDSIMQSFRTGTNLTHGEHSTAAAKYFTDLGPNFLIHQTTSDRHTRDAWRQKAASVRSRRMAVIVVQMMIRRDALKNEEERHLLDLLPKGEERRILIDLVSSNGYSRQDINDMIHVISAKTDQERCERFLQLEGYKPIWLLHFVMRPASKIRSIATLYDLMSYCEKTYDGRREWSKDEMVAGLGNQRAKMAMLNMSPDTFGHTLKYLSTQSMILEGRLLVKVADLAIQYIRNMSEWDSHPDKIFYDQCQLFNYALEVLAPSQRKLPPTWYRPMAYYWEAQKRLLSMSASLGKQLLVSKSGFRAVREVLAGLDKNPAEMHISTRHSDTWPPYLEIGDGIDEMADAEDNWSRSVSAGSLQQEAGFALDHRDRVLDILQGRAPDGTPTIQQRITRQPHPNVGVWEATIRATRNAEEAWARFCDPPEPGMVPGVKEYGAMFTKLCLRDADPEMGMRPGDRALNFPVKRDPNLSEFALSRIQAPSVEKLYQEMRRVGIRPSGGCLSVLVANSPTLEIGHQYLRDSTENVWPLMSYGRRGPSPRKLREIRTPLIAAYVKLICTLGRRPGRELLRAVRLCDKRFEDDDGSRVWAPYTWGIILKAFSDKTSGLGRFGRTLAEQLRVYHLVLDRIESSCLPRLSVMVQFSKCLRKAGARAVGQHLRDLESYHSGENSPLRFLYDTEYRESHIQEMEAYTSDRRLKDPWHYLLVHGANRLKQMCKELVNREVHTQTLFNVHDMASLEQMLVREDPVRAGDAYELMASWAFAGEYEEMASMLEWLVRQWDNADVLEQLEGYEEIPGFANFNETLCLFRKYAEPMLSEERVSRIRESIEKAQVMWAWPDEEVMVAFNETRNPSYEKLGHVMEWIRYRQAIYRGEHPETLLRPTKWEEAGFSERMSYAYSRPGGPLWDMGAEEA